MGLVRDLSTTVGTFSSGKKSSSYLSDVGTNFVKSAKISDNNVLSPTDSTVSSTETAAVESSQTLPEITEKMIKFFQDLGLWAEPNSQHVDVRGLKQFFRSDGTKTLRNLFKYNVDFHCDNVDYFNNKGNADYKPFITPVKLYEFQPYAHTELGTLVEELGPIFDSDSPKREAIFKDMGKNLITNLFLSKGVQRNFVVDRVAQDTNTFYKNDINTRSYFDQMTMIKNMFRFGRWLNIYVLPAYENANLNYFYDDPTGSLWQSSGKSDHVGGSDADGFLGKIVPAFASMFGSPTSSNESTLLSNPKWNATPGKFNRSFNIKFNLINDTTKHLKENYKFIQNFYSGTMPVAMQNSIMQPPNVYMVEVPGRLFWYWCSIKVKVTEKGKIRVNDEMNLWLRDRYGYNNISRNNIKVFTNDHSSVFPAWPEVWEIEVTVNNLTPESFTTYAHYLMNGPADESFRSSREAKYGAVSVLLDGGGVGLFGALGGALYEKAENEGVAEATSPLSKEKNKNK